MRNNITFFVSNHKKSKEEETKKMNDDENALFKPKPLYDYLDLMTGAKEEKEMEQTYDDAKKLLTKITISGSEIWNRRKELPENRETPWSKTAKKNFNEKVTSFEYCTIHDENKNKSIKKALYAFGGQAERAASELFNQRIENENTIDENATVKYLFELINSDEFNDKNKPIFHFTIPPAPPPKSDIIFPIESAKELYREVDRDGLKYTYKLRGFTDCFFAKPKLAKESKFYKYNKINELIAVHSPSEGTKGKTLCMMELEATIDFTHNFEHPICEFTVKYTFDNSLIKYTGPENAPEITKATEKNKNLHLMENKKNELDVPKLLHQYQTINIKLGSLFNEITDLAADKSDELQLELCIQLFDLITECYWFKDESSKRKSKKFSVPESQLTEFPSFGALENEIMSIFSFFCKIEKNKFTKLNEILCTLQSKFSYPGLTPEDTIINTMIDRLSSAAGKLAIEKTQIKPNSSKNNLNITEIYINKIKNFEIKNSLFNPKYFKDESTFSQFLEKDEYARKNNNPYYSASSLNSALHSNSDASLEDFKQINLSLGYLLNKILKQGAIEKTNSVKNITHQLELLLMFIDEIKKSADFKSKFIDKTLIAYEYGKVTDEILSIFLKMDYTNIEAFLKIFHTDFYSGTQYKLLQNVVFLINYQNERERIAADITFMQNEINTIKKAPPNTGEQLQNANLVLPKKIARKQEVAYYLDDYFKKNIAGKQFNKEIKLIEAQMSKTKDEYNSNIEQETNKAELKERFNKLFKKEIDSKLAACLQLLENREISTSDFIKSSAETAFIICKTLEKIYSILNYLKLVNHIEIKVTSKDEIQEEEKNSLEKTFLLFESFLSQKHIQNKYNNQFQLYKFLLPDEYGPFEEHKKSEKLVNPSEYILMDFYNPTEKQKETFYGQLILMNPFASALRFAIAQVVADRILILFPDFPSEKKVILNSGLMILPFVGFLLAVHRILKPKSNTYAEQALNVLANAMNIFVISLDVAIFSDLYLHPRDGNIENDYFIKTILPAPTINTAIYLTWALVPDKAKERWFPKESRLKYLEYGIDAIFKFEYYSGASFMFIKIISEFLKKNVGNLLKDIGVPALLGLIMTGLEYKHKILINNLVLHLTSADVLIPIIKDIFTTGNKILQEKAYDYAQGLIWPTVLTASTFFILYNRKRFFETFDKKNENRGILIGRRTKLDDSNPLIVNKNDKNYFLPLYFQQKDESITPLLTGYKSDEGSSGMEDVDIGQGSYNSNVPKRKKKPWSCGIS